jgi:hypothetical protein
MPSCKRIPNAALPRTQREWSSDGACSNVSAWCHFGVRERRFHPPLRPPEWLKRERA